MDDQRRPKSSQKTLLGRIWGVLRWIMLWPVLCWIGRMLVRFFAVVGFVAVAGGLGFIYAPEIIIGLDMLRPEYFDAQLGTNRKNIERLHEPGYFSQATGIVSPEQKTLACISSPEHRVLITDSGDIPELLKKAILASEDKNFFEHEGVDMWGVARAAFNQYVLHVSSSGASTITMQIAKDLRKGTNHRSTPRQKISDIIMAIRIEREFLKLQLLLKYVNMPFLGRDQYGFQAASWAYFGKPVQGLELHQVAMLVALINKPSLLVRSYARDRSLKYPEKIREANWGELLRGTRRVLERMSQEGYIDDATHARAADAVDQKLRDEVLPLGAGCGANSYYMESARQEAIQILQSLNGRSDLDRGGYTLAVPHDRGLEDVLGMAVKMTEATYLARHENDPDNDQLRLGAFAVQFDGAVLAEVGNVDFKRLKHDVMRLGWRQPGSAFKIYTYGGLVEHLVNEVLLGEHPPETLDDIVREVMKRCTVLDEPVGVSLGRGRGVKEIRNFRSNNPKEKQYWGWMLCKDALGRSQNAAAIRAGQQAGIKHIIELTYRLGMPKDPKHTLQPYPTCAIGSCEANPLGMTGAAAFVNGGFKVTPRFINDLCKDGKSLLNKDEMGRGLECDMKGKNRPLQERVIHPAVALIMSDILQAPLTDEFGTAKSLRKGVVPGMDILGTAVGKLSPDERKKRMLAFPIEEAGELACKTGTATNADGRTSDVWLVCFVPGPLESPEKGIMLVFWMGKDSKAHSLGNRGADGGSGFAETGGRNWTHSAATVFSFLQKERGLLQPGNRFKPIYRDDVLFGFDAKKLAPPKDTPVADSEESVIVDPSDPNTPPELLEQFLKEQKAVPSPDEEAGTTGENSPTETSRD